MYLLFDIGGTNMRLAISKDGKTLGEPVIVTTPAEDFEAGIKQFMSVAAKLTEGSRIDAACGGIPGTLNYDKSMITRSPNMPGWNGKPLKERLEENLNAKVFLENDTSMIGLGEAMYGAGKGYDIVVYITVSTGVGGTRIVHGAIDENSLGFEPGHQILVADGPQCGCGGSGHLEALISGSAFEKKYRTHPKNIKDPNIWEEAALTLALGLNNVLVLWSPHIVLLGGPMMRDIPIERVRFHLKNAVKIFTNIPPVEMMSLGQKAGLLGSLVYLKQRSHV